LYASCIDFPRLSIGVSFSHSFVINLRKLGSIGEGVGPKSDRLFAIIGGTLGMPTWIRTLSVLFQDAARSTEPKKPARLSLNVRNSRNSDPEEIFFGERQDLPKRRV
jgi:hypothetical protein